MLRSEVISVRSINASVVQPLLKGEARASEQAPSGKTKAPWIFDVRKHREYEAAPLANAELATLADVNEHLARFRESGPFLIHCQSGYRSILAASILKSRGIHHFQDVRGKWKALAA